MVRSRRRGLPEEREESDEGDAHGTKGEESAEEEGGKAKEEEEEERKAKEKARLDDLWASFKQDVSAKHKKPAPAHKGKVTMIVF